MRPKRRNAAIAVSGANTGIYAGGIYRKKHGWIDIADDLPEPETLVLLSFEECDHTEVGQRIIYDDGKEAFHPWDSYIGNMPYYEMDMTVNAWMPLPKPYRRGGTH